MTEETQDSEMTGGDETIIHSSSRTPGPLDTSTIGKIALGQLTRGRSKTPTLNYVSKEELNQFAGHLGGVVTILLWWRLVVQQVTKYVLDDLELLL